MYQLNTEINLSELTFECQESLKESIIQRLRDDKESMKEIQNKINEDIAELVELGIEDNLSLEIRINMDLEDMATKILEEEFFGEVTIGE